MVRTEDIWPLAQEDCDWLDLRIDLAIHDTRKETRDMSVYELKQALRDITGIDQLTISNAPNGNQLLHIEGKTLEVGPMASNEEIRLALQNPFIRTENTKMTYTGYKPGAIRAALDAAKQQAQGDLEAAMGTLAEAQVKAAEVPAAIKQVAGQIKREAEDALQEFAEFTNGGPA